MKTLLLIFILFCVSIQADNGVNGYNFSDARDNMSRDVLTITGPNSLLITFTSPNNSENFNEDYSKFVPTPTPSSKPSFFWSHWTAGHQTHIRIFNLSCGSTPQFDGTTCEDGISPPSTVSNDGISFKICRRVIPKNPDEDFDESIAEIEIHTVLVPFSCEAPKIKSQSPLE